MKLSRLIARLQDAQNMHGDIDVHLPDVPVDSVSVNARLNGVSATENGIPVARANELVVDLRPKETAQ